MTDEITYTNTALATARRCLTEYDLGYLQRLEPVGDERETLAVGSAWHKAFEVAHREGDQSAGYQSIRETAPSRLWAEKLGRLYAAHLWYWSEQPLRLLEAERTFRVDVAGVTFEGQLDGIVELEDGRRGVLERKTTSDGLEAESSYWDRLTMDVQVGLYSLALDFVPSFILYDVVRKPTISPKALTKKDATRLRAELDEKGIAHYFEDFTDVVIEHALYEGRESPELYGARLTADIGNRPEFYFARREVARTRGDFATLVENLSQQVALIENAKAGGLLHRNPDACNTFGRCRFFGLCSSNVRPRGDFVPDGYRRREHLHPGLVGPETPKA